MTTGMRIEVDGIDEAARRIKSLVSALEAQDVEKVLLQGAQIIRDNAKRRVRVRTGRLRRAIKAKKGKRRGKLFSTAFAAVDYKVAPHAYLVEYGTRKTRAQPYFRPAVDSTQGEVKQVVTDGIAGLIGRAVK